MNVSTILLATILALWLGLSLWRSAGMKQMERIERSYREYYQSRAGEQSPPPPVRWDFEQDKLVEIPPEEVVEPEGSGGLAYAAVRTTDRRLPFSAYGILLARMSASWFHGLFAAVSLVLAGWVVGSRT